MNVVLLCRVSTNHQDYTRQVNELTQFCQGQGWNVLNIFANKVSGAKKMEERAEILEMIEYVRSNDVDKVVVLEISRLGRNTLEALKVIQLLNEQGICLYVKNYNLETIIDGTKFRLRQQGKRLAFTILEERIDIEGKSPAVVKCDVTAISSENQFKAKANAKQSIYGNLEVDVDAASSNKKQVALVDFTQVYYTMAADNQTLDAPFADNETLDNIKQQIHEDTPAAMVTSVDYGRRIVACVETSDMSFDLTATLKASGMNDKLKADASTEIHNKLKDCKVQYYIYGGTTGNAKEILTCQGVDKLLECINNETVYAANSAIPIAYTASFLKDGSTAYTQSTGEYYTSTIEVKKPTPLCLEATGINGRVYSGSIRLTGRRIIDVTADGTPILGNEEEIANEKFTSDAKSSAYTEIPADVDIASVRVYFDYEGQNKSGFGNDNGIRLSTYIQNGVDLTKLSLAHIHIEGTGQLFCYKVNGWVNLIYSGKCYHKGIQDK